MWPKEGLKHFRLQKSIFLGSKKSIWGPKWGPKRPISVSYELNLAIRSYIGWGTHLMGHFLVYVMGNMAKGGFEEYWRAEKYPLYGALESKFGV